MQKMGAIKKYFKVYLFFTDKRKLFSKWKPKTYSWSICCSGVTLGGRGTDALGGTNIKSESTNSASPSILLRVSHTTFSFRNPWSVTSW